MPNRNNILFVYEKRKIVIDFFFQPTFYLKTPNYIKENLFNIQKE